MEAMPKNTTLRARRPLPYTRSLCCAGAASGGLFLLAQIGGVPLLLGQVFPLSGHVQDGCPSFSRRDHVRKLEALARKLAIVFCPSCHNGQCRPTVLSSLKAGALRIALKRPVAETACYGLKFPIGELPGQSPISLGPVLAAVSRRVWLTRGSRPQSEAFFVSNRGRSFRQRRCALPRHARANALDR
jgi:hypothetical protein